MATVDLEYSKQVRYESWRSEVRDWANKHKISLRSAYSILSEYDPERDLNHLLSWVECDDLINILGIETGAIVKVGQTWGIDPNDTYPNGWEDTITRIIGNLVFWQDRTHTNIRDFAKPGWNLKR